MKYGVFLTRAQPVTLAHIACIRQMLAESDRALVIIGSANKSGMLRNPFPIDLRLDMTTEAISETFPEAHHHIKVIALDDLDYENSTTNQLWGDYLYAAITSAIGSQKFAYYTGEQLEQSTNWFGDRLGREITPRLIELTDPDEKVTATAVRDAITLGDTGFIIRHCPASVVTRRYTLLAILLKVINDPQEDFSTLQ